MGWIEIRIVRSCFAAVSMAATVWLALGCSPDATTVSCDGDQCLFVPGGENDPVLKLALTASGDEGGLCPDAFSDSVRVFADDMSSGANDSSWPGHVGYAGDFNGDWWTDGDVAQFYNPNWGFADPGAPMPTTTGFIKFLGAWPQPGSSIHVYLDLATSYTSTDSDATLVVYFFDGSGGLLDVQTNTRVAGARDWASFNLEGASAPTGTERIAVVPMAYLDGAEMGTVYYDNLVVDYEIAGHSSTTPVAGDDFASFDASLQPTGWLDEGDGDWFVDPAGDWATVWNPSWNDPPQAADVTAELSQTFAVSGGADITASLFVASTFTDPNSYAELELALDDGSVITSGVVTGATHGAVSIPRTAMDPSVSAVTVTLRAVLGSDETSSLYVDDLLVSTVAGAPAPSFLPDDDNDGIATLCDNCPNHQNSSQADADDDGIGDTCDACPNDPNNDIDGDGVCGDVDNCPTVHNPGQADSNGDGLGDACVDPSATIHPSAVLGEGVKIGVGTEIKEGVTIGDNTCIGDNVLIKERTSIGSSVTIGNDSEIKEDTVISDGVSIGRLTLVKERAWVGADSVIGNRVEVKEDTVLGARVVLGNRVRIKERVSLGDDVTVLRRTEVKEDSSVGESTQIGERTRIGSRVTVGVFVTIGNNVFVADDEVIGDHDVIPDGASVP